MKVIVKTIYKGDKLQEMRKARGFSQAALAEKAGINLRMLQYYEQGDKDLNGARLDTLLKLCAALECRLIDIVNAPELVELLHQYGE